MSALILTKLALLWDMAVVLGTMLFVRTAMTHSPLFDAAAPQWAEERYWAAGTFAALTYALVAWASRFYSRRNHARPAVVPALNLGIFAFLFLLGMLACRRFAAIAEGQQLISKRALLFSIAISYIMTTVVHYLLASRLLKKGDGNVKNKMKTKSSSAKSAKSVDS